MNDIIYRYLPVISERSAPTTAIEAFSRMAVWDAELRAAIMHIEELERAYEAIRRREQAEREK